MYTWFLIKKEKQTMEKNRTSSTNGTGLIGYMHVEKWKSILITFHKIQVQVDQGLQYKTGDKESHRNREWEKDLEYLNRRKFPEHTTNGSGSNINN